MYSQNQGTWTGGGGGGGGNNKTPPRARPRPAEHMGYGGHRVVDVRGPEMDMYMARGPHNLNHDDDGAGSSAGGSAKEKGRGSYKCGRVSLLLYCVW